MISLGLILLPLVQSSSSSAWPPSAYTNALQTLSQLSTSEKVQLVSGQNNKYGQKCGKPCDYVGFIPGIPRLAISSVYLEDGPQGVADGMKEVTAWPSAMTVAQTWDATLMKQWGAAMGAEQKAKGSNVMLGGPLPQLPPHGTTGARHPVQQHQCLCKTLDF